ncbi:MAG: addiction module protein, partial [Candidatus Binataceae bacterium]
AAFLENAARRCFGHAPRYRAVLETAVPSFSMANGREIIPELLKLPARERARLATELVQSLDESEDPDAAEAWLEELERRAREVLSGAAKLEDWTEVRRRIELRLRAR